MQRPPATLYFELLTCIASISISSSHLFCRRRRLHAALLPLYQARGLTNPHGAPTQRWLALDPSQRCICTTKKKRKILPDLPISTRKLGKMLVLFACQLWIVSIHATRWVIRSTTHVYFTNAISELPSTTTTTLPPMFPNIVACVCMYVCRRSDARHPSTEQAVRCLWSGCTDTDLHIAKQQMINTVGHWGKRVKDQKHTISYSTVHAYTYTGSCVTVLESRCCRSR